jgi:hypothetical protein
MITIHKKRKNCQVYFHDEADTEFLSFEPEQLVMISKCVSIEYNIKNKIILNIPENITSIIFSGWFNLDIQPYLHPHIKSLKFGFDFNQSMDNLPNDLEYLTLGAKFNQTINNLPLGLKTLIIGGIFSQTVDMLPENLEVLYLSGGFSHFIDNLPIGLKTLRLLGYSFNQPIDSLPNTIEILQLNPKYKRPIYKLPSNLKSLVFDKYVECKVDLHQVRKITNAKIYGKDIK